MEGARVRISKPVALLIGLVTLVPVVYMFVFLASVFVEVGGDKEAIPVFGTFERMMMFQVSVMLLGFVLLGFYILHAFKNENLASDRRILWVLIIFMANMFGMAAYWYVHIWRTSRGSDAAL
jgi:hypothetical protein